MLLVDFLSNVKDNRSQKGKRFSLESILSLLIIGYMSGCTSLAGIYRLGKNLPKKHKIRLGFKKGITPSHPTITEIAKKIDLSELTKAIYDNINSNKPAKNKHIAIDGKSVRNKYGKRKNPLHIVSAFLNDEHLMSLQKKSELAGGEIVAAEKIIDEIKIENKIITGDALFAQEKLCSKIVGKSGNFLMKVKKNKKALFNDIRQQFHLHENKSLPIYTYEMPADKGHGRIEERKIEVINVEKIQNFGRSNLIKQIMKTTRKSYDVVTKKISVQQRFLITNMPKNKASPGFLLRTSIEHWGIENHLHRVKDNIFKEDMSNIASQKSQLNNSILRAVAIFLMKKINSSITSAINKIHANINHAIKTLFRRI